MITATERVELERAFEDGPENTKIIRNVKRCDYCQGSVDRICANIPDPHGVFVTKYFDCTRCGAMGDPFLGMMTPPRSHYDNFFNETADEDTEC